MSKLSLVQELCPGDTKGRGREGQDVLAITLTFPNPPSFLEGHYAEVH